MITSLYSGASGMTAQQLKLDTVTNNLANVDTTGYKRVRTEFVDLFYQNIKAAGTPVANQTSNHPTGIYKGLGTKVAATNRIFTEGNLLETGNPLDTAIAGDGFFQVQMQDGTVAYTRNGALKVENGILKTNTGLSLLPNITVPAGSVSISIDLDGSVSVEQADGTQAVIGQIPLVRFANPSGLNAIGDSLFRPTAASGDPLEGIANQDGYGSIMQSYLEKSNVNAVREMVEMIATQRAYELNSRSIQTSDSILSTVASMKR